MAVICPPYIEELDERTTETTETETKRKRGGWTLNPQPRVGLDLGSDDELLMVENMTEARWAIYHNYHRLSIIEANELLVFHVHKHGTLSARPLSDANDFVEYLTLPLNYYVTYVHIYRHSISEGIEVYDMRKS